jgi:hypothetical protein
MTHAICHITCTMNADSFQSKGGKARDKALTDEKKKQIAFMAAKARWGDKPLRAIRKGNFISEFGIDVECYVLDDPEKTGVISQIGMGRAIGLAPRGNALPRFLASKAISQYLGAELAEKIANPLKFTWEGAGAEQQPPGIIHGFDVTLLIDICRLIIQAEAEGKLGKRYESVVRQSRIILHASAKSGIKQLVYALAGYSPTTQEVISAFKAFVQEEARKYEKEFPPDLYEQWQRLYQIEVPPHGNPWNFKHLTIKHVYFPLAKSSGKLLQLMRALKASGGDKRKKLFQFLSELGTRALRIHMGRVLEMAESSANSMEYETKIAKRFGGQQELDLVLPPCD